jgi:hypothetical protein
VNTICDSALVNGYGRQAKAITPAMIEEVVEDLRLNLKSSAAKMSGTPMSGPAPEEDMSRKALVRTLLRLARLLDSGQEADTGKSQGVAG